MLVTAQPPGRGGRRTGRTGITTYYDTMQFAAHESEAMLLGSFQVSILHNVVHLLFGVAGIGMARSAAASRTYLVAGGVVYLVLWVYGLLVGHHSSANFIPLNAADNWLRLVLGVGMIGLGLALSRAARGSGAASTRR